MQENDFILLLHKRFTGAIDARESQVLEAWINESSAHAELAAQYLLIWNKSVDRPREFVLDMDAEFHDLKQRIAREDAPRAKTVSIGYRLLRIAASLTLLIAAVWGYRQFVGTPVETMVVSASKLEKRQIDLPDGTRVWLRQNGTLEYPATFSGNFRQVKLNGEAYFEVTHRADQPFRVQIPGNGLVEVLGTEFDVKSFAGEPEAIVLVRSGKVRFSPDGMKNGPALGAGEKAVYNRQSAKINSSTVSTFNDLAWHSGGLEFVRTPLKEVVADLEKYYQVKIDIRNPALFTCKHTSPLTNQPVEQVLSALSVSYGLTVSSPAPGQFILSGGAGCK